MGSLSWLPVLFCIRVILCGPLPQSAWLAGCIERLLGCLVTLEASTFLIRGGLTVLHPLCLELHFSHLLFFCLDASFIFPSQQNEPPDRVWETGVGTVSFSLCVCKSWGRSRWLRQALTGEAAVTFLSEVSTLNQRPSWHQCPLCEIWSRSLNKH